jgi:hypothetical protein
MKTRHCSSIGHARLLWRKHANGAAPIGELAVAKLAEIIVAPAHDWPARFARTSEDGTHVRSRKATYRDGRDFTQKPCVAARVAPIFDLDSDDHAWQRNGRVCDGPAPELAHRVSSDAFHGAAWANRTRVGVARGDRERRSIR